MGGDIGYTPRIFAGGLGKLHTLTLSLAAYLVVIARHLQGQLEQQLLHRLDHYPGDTVSLGRELGQIDQARHGQPRPLAPDRAHQPLSLAQREPTDAIDFLRDDHFTGLQIGDHPDELGTVGASTGGRLVVDTSDVIARRPRAVLDLGLTGEILLVSAESLKINRKSCSSLHNMLYLPCPITLNVVLESATSPIDFQALTRR